MSTRRSLSLVLVIAFSAIASAAVWRFATPAKAQIAVALADHHSLRIQSHADDSALDPYVEQASEFSSRARANVYFPNPQSIFQGAQFNFVNVGAGNLTFVRRDLVASGRIPIIVARVYDSNSEGTVDFGPGWRLSAAETISVEQERAHLNSESGSTIDFVRAGEDTFSLERDYPSDYIGLTKVNPVTLHASLRTGFVKEFKLIHGQFRLTRVTDRNGNVLRLIYDKAFVSKLQNANHWIALARDKKGRIVTAQDDQGRKVTYAYDDAGRLIETDDLGGHAWNYRYSGDGKLASAMDPLQRLNFSVKFDDAGRVARLELPSGVIQFQYDAATRSSTVIDKKRLASRFFQNEDGITTRVINTLGEETAIAFDSARNVVSLTRDGLPVERMEYDQQHRIVFRQSMANSGTVSRKYTYDPSTGLLAAIHSSDSSDRSFAYDNQGNLITAGLPDGQHKFEYSQAGDLARFSLQTASTTFTSDPDGLIASMTDEQQALTTMHYKAGGELAAATFPDGTQAEYKYQPSGLRAALLFKDGRRVEYGYDPAGNLTSTKVFDAKGTQVNGQILEMNTSYQLSRRVLFDGTETTFQYDPNGNLIQINKGASITRFQYDGLDRLVAVDTPDGQRLTYSYKPGERSLLEEYAHASVLVADLRDTGFTFTAPFRTMASRPLTASFGAVRFSESLGAFQLANSDGSEIVLPHEGVEGALAKLHLVQPGMTPQALRSGFNAPFNTIFMPPEYLTINCCPECYGGPHGWYCPPCDPPPPPPPPAVRIKLGGANGTDITGTTQTVVVGQQIVLYASYSPPSGASITSQSWSVPGGTIVGGYSASSTSAVLTTNVTLSQQSATFYWVFASSSQVTFTLNLDNGQTSRAQASFNINAPSPATPTVSLPTNGTSHINTFTGCTNYPTQPFLVFGNISGPVPGCTGSYTGAAGIAFSPPTTAAPPGQFFFVQLVTSDLITYPNLSCAAVPGLDGAYPYQSKYAQAVNDAPFAALPYSSITRSFGAAMYLMWRSSTPSSIPVPIGSVAWSFSSSSSQSNGLWSTPSGGGSASQFTIAYTTSGYPVWNNLAVPPNNNCR